MANEHTFLRNQLPSLAGMVGAVAARNAISSVYESRTGVEPPLDPGAEDANWRQAIGWTAVLAAGAAIGRLLARYAVGETVDKQLSGQRTLQSKE